MFVPLLMMMMKMNHDVDGFCKLMPPQHQKNEWRKKEGDEIALTRALLVN